MNKEYIHQVGWDLVYLITCVLHDKIPKKERVYNMDLAVLYQTAEKHMLTAIVAMALESFWIENPTANDDMHTLLKEAIGKAIRKNLLLDTEREQILSFFEKKKIWYMPLKGSVLKDLYPKYGMRQMADNDILYDATYQSVVYDFMKQRGYKAEYYKTSNQDVYTKQPVYNFELHTALFGDIGDERWVEYYADIKKRLMPDEHKQYGFHFSDEDFYIYVTTHACKHFTESGTGIRTLLDCYVFLKHKKSSLDRDYIAEEVDKLGIAEFEEQSRILAEKLFSENIIIDGEGLTDEYQRLFNYYFSSGIYGTKEQRAINRIERLQGDEQSLPLKKKLMYCLKRMFPTQVNVRYKWQLPFYWIGRTFRLIFTGRKQIAYEMRLVWKNSKGNLDEKKGIDRGGACREYHFK